MNKKQYNNVIKWTLEHQCSEQTEDSLETVRTIFKNMGVALPNGSINAVYETIKSNDYMGWRACTMKEAQKAADEGTAAIGISENRIVLLAATDEEEPVAETVAIMTLSETTSAYAVSELQYYAYSYGTTTNSGGGTTTTIPISYCGGSDYKDVTKHNMVLQSDGYYVCSRCGYRIKSPELEDYDILTRNDYLQVLSIHRARLMYLMEDYTDIAEALLRTIDNIRSREQYKFKYESVNTAGYYSSLYPYTKTSYDMRISIGANYILSDNCLVTTDGLAKIVLSTLGAALSYPYSLIISFMDFELTGDIPFSDALGLVADKIDDKLGKVLNIVATASSIYSAYSESAEHIGDTLVTVRVTCPDFERTSRYTFADSQQIIFTSEAHSEGPNPYDLALTESQWKTAWKNKIYYHNWAASGKIYNPEYLVELV